MGDRISIRFVNGEEKSPYLFSHWGGIDFKEQAEDYAEKVMTRDGEYSPLDRGEPRVAMVDFIHQVTKGQEEIDSGLYLTCSENDGDNSDNGHYDIDLSKDLPLPKLKITPLSSNLVRATIKARLEYLRQELRAGTMSYGEIAELQSLAEYIDKGDVELLEATGVPEFPEEEGNQ